MTDSTLEKNLGESIPIKVDAVQTQIRFLQGKVLTIIDAAFSNGEQKKAVKDLINKTFSDQLTYVWQLCWPETRFLTTDEAHSTIEGVDEIEANAETVD